MVRYRRVHGSYEYKHVFNSHVYMCMWLKENVEYRERINETEKMIDKDRAKKKKKSNYVSEGDKREKKITPHYHLSFASFPPTMTTAKRSVVAVYCDCYLKGITGKLKHGYSVAVYGGGIRIVNSSQTVVVE